MTKKIDYKARWKDAEAQLVNCRKGCKDLHDKLSAIPANWECAKCGDYGNGDGKAHVCPITPCPHDFLAVMFVLVAIFCVVIGGGFVYYTQCPIIQYKWIEGHTVYRPSPQQSAILKDCQEDYRSDKITIRVQGKIIDRLRMLLMQEMEKTKGEQE